MTTISTPSIKQLKRAIEIAEQIESLELELKVLLGGIHGGGPPPPQGASSSVSAPEKAPRKRLQARKKRTFSPETREKMAAAQRARWAKEKKGTRK